MLTRRSMLAGAAVLGATVPVIASARPHEQVDVLVIGAGLSGLSAATALRDAGVNVLVLEGKDRPGGRIQTLHDVAGTPEAGGTQVSSSYGRFVKFAKRFDIALTPQPPAQRGGPPEFFISLNGEPIMPDAWAAHVHNPFDGPLAKVSPWALPFVAMGRDNPLPDVASWRDPAFAANDISVAQHLGWTSAQLKLGFGTNPGYGASAWSQSALMWFQIMKAISAPGGQLVTVAGGNDAVPRAMAESLGDRVRYDAAVRQVHSNRDGVEVRTTDGGRYLAKMAVVTLPTAALASVDLRPVPTAVQEQGIRQLAYNRVARAYFTPTQRFWEEDGLPPSIWSDSFAGRVFALRGGGGDDITGMQAFVTGPAAAHLDRLPRADAFALVQAEIERIRPAAKGAIKPAAYVSWGDDPFAGGAYACWGPGQVSGFANALAEPLENIVFAGEHTARNARGIEGALESAERALSELNGRL